jgi:uncharacterized membrane protein
MTAPAPDAPTGLIIELVEIREVSYCVPQLIAVVVIFGAVYIVVGLAAPQPARALALIGGAVLWLSAYLIAAYAFFLKPEFLKTERHETVLQEYAMNDMAENNDG